MTSQEKLRLDHLHADLAEVNDLLDRITEEDVMARIGLESRREQLEGEILNYVLEKEKKNATATLHFSGKPVSGTRGIESRFAASAVDTFQNLVAMTMAHLSGTLSQRGPVADRELSTLHITNIARGSFGFVLEEMHPQANQFGVPLVDAVNKVTETFDALSTNNEKEFQENLKNVDQRVLNSAGKFFELMHRNEATLRLVTDNADRKYGGAAVSRAAERGKSITTKTAHDLICGKLTGLLPDSRRFEFRCDGGRGTITGKLADTLRTNDLDRLNHKWLNVDAKARIDISRVFRKSKLVRETYTLVALEPVSDGEA